MTFLAATMMLLPQRTAYAYMLSNSKLFWMEDVEKMMSSPHNLLTGYGLPQTVLQVLPNSKALLLPRPVSFDFDLLVGRGSLCISVVVRR